MDLLCAIHEEKIGDVISLDELEFTICGALDLKEYFVLLKKLLAEKYAVQPEKFQTDLAAVYLYKSGIMTNQEIRQAMVAFNVTSRLYSSDGVPLKVSRILKALRMTNRVMSVKCLEVWIDNYKPYLMCKGQRRPKPSAFTKQRESVLYPHEFLILVSQAKNNMQILDKVLHDLTDTKLASKQVNNTLKKAEVNGFEKFIRNEVRDSLNLEIPEKGKIRCPDISNLKKNRAYNFDGFKILKKWEEQIKDRFRRVGDKFKDEEIVEEPTEENKCLAMKHAIGEQAVKDKKEVDDKCNAIKSLYSLCGVKPPFITDLEYSRYDSKHCLCSPSTGSLLGALPTPSIKVVAKTTTNRKKQSINFVVKNKELTKCYPINRQRFLTLRGFQSSRPVTAQSRKLSRCSTASSRVEVISRMSSIFNEEMENVMKKDVNSPLPSLSHI